MPPIGARWIAAEALDELLRRARTRRRVQDLAVIQPYLEVVGRGLDYHGRLKAFRLHPLDRFVAQVVDQAQRVETCGPDVNMSAFRVFVAEPLDRLFNLDGVLPFPQNHLAGVALDADIEALAAHRAVVRLTLIFC